jgi:hypothetical protein
MNRNNPLLALTSAAMALPALSATQPVESTISIRAAVYEEEDAPAHQILVGADDRYDIDIGQFRLLTPVGRHWSVGLAVTHETMSGASPWYNIQGANQQTSLIMSGATIRDSRTEVSLSTTHYQETSSISIGLSQSEEDDYEAKAVSLGGEWDFNNRLSTLSLGISYSSDEIRPTDAPNFGRSVKEDKRSRSVSVGWGQILNKNSSLHASLDVTDHEGFLSDPYKLWDTRPDERLEWALALKYRRYFDNQNAALHLDYRYYHDDWGINSHTVYSAWHQRLGDDFRLVPNLRYYSQTEADFYSVTNNFTQPLTTAQSSDFRLAGYGAYTFGLKAIYDAASWRVSLSVDRYISSEDYGHSGSDGEHPAAVKFLLTSIGLDFRF